MIRNINLASTWRKQYRTLPCTSQRQVAWPIEKRHSIVIPQKTNLFFIVLIFFIVLLLSSSSSPWVSSIFAALRWKAVVSPLRKWGDLCCFARKAIGSSSRKYDGYRGVAWQFYVATNTQFLACVVDHWSILGLAEYLTSFNHGSLQLVWRS